MFHRNPRSTTAWFTSRMSTKGCARRGLGSVQGVKWLKPLPDEHGTNDQIASNKKTSYWVLDMAHAKQFNWLEPRRVLCLDIMVRRPLYLIDRQPLQLQLTCSDILDSLCRTCWCNTFWRGDWDQARPTIREAMFPVALILLLVDVMAGLHRYINQKRHSSVVFFPKK